MNDVPEKEIKAMVERHIISPDFASSCNDRAIAISDDENICIEVKDVAKETFDFVLDVNIKGTMNCTQAVLKSMIANKYGKVINMSSIAAICGLYDKSTKKNLT